MDQERDNGEGKDHNRAVKEQRRELNCQEYGRKMSTGDQDTIKVYQGNDKSENKIFAQEEQEESKLRTKLDNSSSGRAGQEWRSADQQSE